MTKISYRHITNNLGLGEYDIDFIYSNNNVVKATETWIASGATNTWFFDYADIPNTHFKNEFFPDYFVFSDSYTLAYALSKNLVSKMESSNGGKSIFNYTFSDQGKVLSVTEIFTAPVNSYIKTANYEYACQ